MNFLKNTKLRLTAIAVSGALLTASASALNIGYVNAGGGNISALSGFGHTVTNVNNPIGLILSQLSAFDAVIVASNSPFSEATNIGNVLADFADAGGGVVLSEFVFQGQWALGGRIMTDGYSPFTIDPLSSGYGLYSTLGTIFDPASPLLNSLPALETNYQGNVGLHNSATLVADWTSGRHALAYSTLSDSKVVGVNLFPGYIQTGTLQLLSNAVEFSTEGGQARVPDAGSTAVLTLSSVLGIVSIRRKLK